MYRNIHPATSDVLTFVLHMNNGIIEASLKPHIGDMSPDNDASENGEEPRRMWKTTQGVVLVPTTPHFDRRPSGESSGNSSTPEETGPLLGDTSHLLICPELAAPLNTVPLNVSDDATGYIYVEPEAAAQRARIFSRNHRFEENSPRGWTLVKRSSIFTAALIRNGIDLRIDVQEHVANSVVWVSTISIRYDVADMGGIESDSITARRAPVLVPQSPQESAESGSRPEQVYRGIGLANQPRYDLLKRRHALNEELMNPAQASED